MVITSAYGSNETQNVVFKQDTGIVDAYGRLRTAEPRTIFSDRGYLDNTQGWDNAVVSGGIVDTSNSLNSSIIKLTVNNTATSSVFRQTRERMIYQPGKSQEILMSFVMRPTINNTQRVGYFSTKDGIFIEHDGINLNFVLRSYSSGIMSEVRISQNNWNIDIMDGNGPSLTILDITKIQTMIIDFEWLGAGTVRCGFIINNQIIYCHEFLHANVVNITYMGHGNLPCRYEIFNTGVSLGTTLDAISTAVSSEGGHELVGNITSSNSGELKKTAGTGINIPLVSFRLNPLYLNAALKLLSTTIFVTTNNQAYFELTKNATLTGAVWSNAGIISQFDNTATSFVGGTLIHASVGGKKTASPSDFDKMQNLLGFSINDIPDHYTVSFRSVTGTVSAFSTVNWQEFY